MSPVKVVPANLPVNEGLATYAVPRQTGSQAGNARGWADANADSIDQYNAWALQREPYSQRVRRWRAQAV